MKIGIIQASSQKKMNQILFQCVERANYKNEHELVNFGVFDSDAGEYSYVQTAFLISLLLEGKAVDFVVTGCSSGQGMMLACNSFPGVLCGYTPSPSDAYLFSSINAGNAVSLPLGLNFGWSGELNLQYTLNALLEAPFGAGYPPQDAGRKQKDTRLLKKINRTVKLQLPEFLTRLEPDFIRSCLEWERVRSYLLRCNTNPSVAALLQTYCRV